MRLTIKDYFKQFLHGYISAGHTVWDDSEEEVKQLTDEFVDSLRNDDDCFTYPIFCDYIAFIDDNLNEDYKRLYTLYCNHSRYTDLLEDYLKHLFN